MYGWMDGWKDGRMEGPAEGRKDGKTEVRADGQRWMNACTSDGVRTCCARRCERAHVRARGHFTKEACILSGGCGEALGSVFKI